MKFKDLKLGMRFEIVNEDDRDTITKGAIVELYPLTNGLVAGHLAVQFDDVLGTWTAGHPDEDLSADLTLLGSEA